MKVEKRDSLSYKFFNLKVNRYKRYNRGEKKWSRIFTWEAFKPNIDKNYNACISKSRKTLN